MKPLTVVLIAPKVEPLMFETWMDTVEDVLNNFTGLVQRSEYCQVTNTLKVFLWL